MKRFLTRWTIPILGFIVLSHAADAQQSSRAKAIAQIAAQFPNSEKSPQQIYDEGLIWHTAKIFAKQFRNFELGALTGPIDEDSYRTVPGPVGSTTDSTATPPGPGNIPGGITSEDTSSVVVNESDTTRTITQRIDRRSIFFSEGHTVTTTAKQDYTEVERREIRKTFLSMFDGLPRDVRIVIELESIQYHGQSATVTAQWKYDIVGHATRLSRPYKNRSPGSLTLRMLRVGDDWLVSDFRGLVNGLKTDVTSR
ncbi:MAG: hypothetical protein F4Y79_00530 [Gemmatimonadetes bacterium]|nr:hypothetical protein [Gemmatimonadota bacterium]MYF16407.1 hypothetical protein [Gemmatimonadota bacterium]